MLHKVGLAGDHIGLAVHVLMLVAALTEFRFMLVFSFLCFPRRSIIPLRIGSPVHATLA